MDELIKELLQLQIRQTEIIGQLLQPDAAQGNARAGRGPQVVPPNNAGDPADRPLQVGDRVRVLNPDRIRTHRNTVYTIVKIGKRVTSVSSNGIRGDDLGSFGFCAGCMCHKFKFLY